MLINNPTEWGRPIEHCDRYGLSRLQPPYEIRGKVTIDGELGAMLYLGKPPGGSSRASIRFKVDGAINAYTMERELDENGYSSVSFVPESKWTVGASETYEFHLRVAKEGGGVLQVGDKKLTLPEKWTREQLTGQFAITAGDGAVALFQDIEVRPGSSPSGRSPPEWSRR